MSNPQMPQEFIAKISEYGVWNYFLILIVAFWAGTTKTLVQIRNGEPPSFVVWITETSVSGFVGFLTYTLCQYNNTDMELSVVISGVCSYHGTKALAITGEMLKIKLTNFIKKD